MRLMKGPFAPKSIDFKYLAIHDGSQVLMAKMPQYCLWLAVLKAFFYLKNAFKRRLTRVVFKKYRPFIVKRRRLKRFICF